MSRPSTGSPEAPPEFRSGSILGHPVLRLEDEPLLTGRALYTADLPQEGALHAAFIRAPLAHAQISSLDLSRVGKAPGVAAVFTAAELDLPPLGPNFVPQAFARPPLATSKVRFQGEPVGVVLAESRAQAEDAAELAEMELDPLEPVVDPETALAPGAPLLFPEAGSNLALEQDFGYDKVVLPPGQVHLRARIVNQRLIPAPLETGAILAIPQGDGLLIWASCQAPHFLRKDLAGWLGLDRDKIDVAAPAVGGGFGAKIATYPEQAVIAKVALTLGRPVRYQENRSESFQAMTHGRGQVQYVELAATEEGEITALRALIVQDGGAYPDTAGDLPGLTALMASGCYRIPEIGVKTRLVATSTTPVAAYRGAGRPEACAMIERVIDLLAAELRLDPAEIRMRNFIPRDAFPFVTASRASYDSGDYAGSLQKALRQGDYEALRREQQARRDSGDPVQLGIGLSSYVEITGFGPESGTVEIDDQGEATVITGVSPHGQGHETSLAQITASVLGLPLERIKVVHSDTRKVPRGGGTMASRSLQKGGSAVLGASTKLLAKATRLASELLEVSPEDLTIVPEGIGVAGAPERKVRWGEIASEAARRGEPLRESESFKPEQDTTFPFGAHLAVCEVDTATGEARLRRHVAVDDCGRIINPVLVQGQVHGGIAQGAGQALLEQAVYDEEGNLVTSNLSGYGFPTARELPSFDTFSTETPTDRNPLGAKGIGESATIGSTPAIQNAVIDALAHLGVRHIDLPLTPERVWQAIRSARSSPW